MPRTLKTAPEIVQTTSHWLTLEGTARARQEPFSDEKVYPILELELPRVGLVRANFEASRYVASSYDEATNESRPVWTEWRIFLRDVRTPDDDRPDLPHLGRPASGIGPATNDAISDACLPLIAAWLDSDAYRQSRRKAAAYAVRREIGAPPSYRIERLRQTLAETNGEIGPMEMDHLRGILDLLGQAADALDREPVAA